MFSKFPPVQDSIAKLALVAASLFPHVSEAQTPGTPALQPLSATAKEKISPFRQERFSERYRDEISKAIATDMDKTIMVVFSVPEKCPPCRAYDTQLKEFERKLTAEGERNNIRVYVVLFDTFEEAEQQTSVHIGKNRFLLAPPVPSTLAIPAIPTELREKLAEPSAQSSGEFLPAQLQRPVLTWNGVIKADKLLAAIEKGVQFTLQQKENMLFRSSVEWLISK